MFDPVPSCDGVETITSEHCRALNAFVLRVAQHAECYHIDFYNRFSFLLDVTDSLKKLLKKEQKDVWPEGADEPVTEFQDKFQLLIYGLGDEGILFHPDGRWRETIPMDWMTSSSWHGLILNAPTKSWLTQ